MRKPSARSSPDSITVSVQEFRGHLFDGVSDGFGSGLEPALADRAMSGPAAGGKQIGRRGVVEAAHARSWLFIAAIRTALSVRAMVRSRPWGTRSVHVPRSLGVPLIRPHSIFWV